MKRIKPATISITALLVFVVLLYIGMQTAWWQTEGRKTPLDGVRGNDHEDELVLDEEHEDGEEDHETTEIVGSSSVGDARALGVTEEDLIAVLEGPIDEYGTDALIREIATDRDLRFGEVRDALNARIN